ncbi:hypothetical protein KCU65_g8533, partial [Aureobasidium melanogenum]
MAPPTKMLNSTEHVNIASSTESAIVKSAITLLDLPQEILNMIAMLLDEEQLPALRVLSKHACHHFSDIFAKFKFGYLHRNLTRTSLQNLINITNHAVFSKYVKSIEISTACIKSPSNLPRTRNAVRQEDSESRQSGVQTAMLVTALKNLKHHGNHSVSLGVFDNHCSYDTNLLRAIDNIPTWDTTSGHGYIKSFGVRKVLPDVNLNQTMFAVREAARLSEYFSQRFSFTTAVKSRMETNLITDDQTDVFLIKGLNRFKSNLLLRYILVQSFSSNPGSVDAPCLTVEVQTGASSHLSLQGQTIALDKWIFARAAHTGRLIQDLPSIFFDNEYRTLIVKDMQLKNQGLQSLCSRTSQHTFECLEISNVDTWISKDLNDPGPITFLKHFRRRSNIEKFRISKLIVNANFYVFHEGDMTIPQPLILATDTIVAEGHDQVQSAFDHLITKILTWREAVTRGQPVP